MRKYSFTETRQNFASVVDEEKNEGVGRKPMFLNHNLEWMPDRSIRA
ncbi:MAG: hypothetical protein JKY87_04780 [Mariprofundus sp.]|nr:hypothetical protein [Mariprofundus sp.]